MILKSREDVLKHNMWVKEALQNDHLPIENFTIFFYKYNILFVEN